MKTNITVSRPLLEKVKAGHHKPGLAPATRYLISIHALSALGEEHLLEKVIDMALDDNVKLDHIREILLQTHLFCGFPRTINAFAKLNKCLAVRDGRGPKKKDYLRDPMPAHEWRTRGEKLFKTIYLKNHTQVIESLKAFHPDLPEWILDEAYGKALSRPGLEARIRELAAIGTLTVLRVYTQLLSHIKGGLHLGANRDQVKEAILQMELYTSKEIVERGIRLLQMGTRNIPSD